MNANDREPIDRRPVPWSACRRLRLAVPVLAAWLAVPLFPAVAAPAPDAPALTPGQLREVRLLPSPTERGEWLSARGDPAQTGRGLLPGRIGKPAVAWKQFVGRWQVLVEVAPAEGAADTTLPRPETLAPEYLHEHAQDWEADTRLLDLAGDGKLVPALPASNVKYARFLPGAKGFQKFVMEDGMGVKNRPDGPRRPVASGALYRYD